MNEFIQDNQVSIYDETAQRIEAAYRAFRQLYDVQFPPPKEPIYPPMPNVEDKPLEGRFLGVKQLGMGLGLLGSVILSASHTIPVFLGKKSALEISLLSFEGIVAISIFVMIEVGLVTFAYSKIEGSPNSETAKQVQELTGWGLKFILVIAILANVYYVLSGNTTIPDDGIFASVWYWTRVAIFLLIGASAPLVALITGDILAIDVLKHRANMRRDIQVWEDKKQADIAQWEGKVKAIRGEYEQALAQWNLNLNSAWNSQKARWGGSVNISVSKPETPALPLSDLSIRQQTDRQGFNRLSNATDKAYQWLIDNPDNQDKNLRELAELIGVGKDSIAKAKKRLSLSE